MPDLLIDQSKISKIIVLTAIFIFGYVHTLAQEISGLTSPFSLCWKYQATNLNITSLASDNESSLSDSNFNDSPDTLRTVLSKDKNKQNLYLSLVGGKLESVNSRTGKKNWETELGGEILQKPIVDKNDIYVASKISEQKDEKIYVRSLSKDSGITNWQTVLHLNSQIFLFETSDEIIIVSIDGEISKIDKNDGALLWKIKLKITLTTSPIVFENRLVFSTVANQLLFFSIKDGNILFKLDTPTSPNFISIVSDRYLFSSDYKANTYLTDLITKKIIWKFRSGAKISNITETRQGILISSLDNFMYLISVEKGKLLWKKRFDDRLLFKPVIFDKYAIVVIGISRSADIILIENGKMINQIVTDDGNYFVNIPIISGGFFIFPTTKGLLAFSNLKTECGFN